MYLEKGVFTLSDGTALVLRSPCPEDAETLLDYLRQTSAETHFLMRDADEFSMTVEDEAAFLNRVASNPRGFMLAAFDGGEAVANCSIFPISEVRKACHRGSFAIAVKQKYCECGLGTLLLQYALEQAKELGYTQVELGVYADNPRAKHVYEKLGFREMGVIPNAFRLADGTFRDEVQMVIHL